MDAFAIGDYWDRTWVRMQECLARLTSDPKRTPAFDPQQSVPKKVRTPAQDLYVRAENPRGELGFFFRATARGDRLFRCRPALLVFPIFLSYQRSLVATRCLT
jgi:NADH-quinone oxidoreductase subunit D